VGEHDLAGALVVGVEAVAVGGGQRAQQAHAEQLLDHGARVVLDRGGA
jgi:phosphoglycolate phosphatase-like HAD superfamily hydrolase